MALRSRILPDSLLHLWLPQCVCSQPSVQQAHANTNSIGVSQVTYQATTLREYTPSDIFWIFAVQLALMWTPGRVFGRIIDTYRSAFVLYPCSILCVFSLCMTSMADGYYHIFLAQGLGFGIVAGGVFTTSMVCLGQWHVRRRSLATGIAATGSSLGKRYRDGDERATDVFSRWNCLPHILSVSYGSCWILRSYPIHSAHDWYFPVGILLPDYFEAATQELGLGCTVVRLDPTQRESIRSVHDRGFSRDVSQVRGDMIEKSTHSA